MKALFAYLLVSLYWMFCLFVLPAILVEWIIVQIRGHSEFWTLRDELFWIFWEKPACLLEELLEEFEE